MASFLKPRNAVGKSELDLFTERSVQTDIESSSYVKVYPLNNVKGNTAPIEFNVQGSAEDYIDLDETKLCLKVRVKKTDGTSLAATDNVFPTNNLLHSLFSDVSLHLNETQIEGGNHMYPYKAYMSTLLLYGNEAKSQQLESCGQYKDQAGKMNDKTNTGFIMWTGWIKELRLLDLEGYFYLDICQQGKLLLNQVNTHFKLT